MKKMKILLFVTVTLIFIGVFVSCGNGNENAVTSDYSAESSTVATETKPTVISTNAKTTSPITAAKKEPTLIYPDSYQAEFAHSISCRSGVITDVSDRFNAEKPTPKQTRYTGNMPKDLQNTELNQNSSQEERIAFLKKVISPILGEKYDLDRFTLSVKSVITTVTTTEHDGFVPAESHEDATIDYIFTFKLKLYGDISLASVQVTTDQDGNITDLLIDTYRNIERFLSIEINEEALQTLITRFSPTSMHIELGSDTLYLVIKSENETLKNGEHWECVLTTSYILLAKTKELAHTAYKSKVVRVSGSDIPDSLWQIAKNKKLSSDPTQRPIVKIDSEEERTAFLSEFGETFHLNTPGSGEKKSFVQETLIYNKAYFENKTLFLIGLPDQTGSASYSLEHILMEKNLIFHINRTVPEISTTDMAFWFLLIEVDNSAIENYTKLNLPKFEAIVR